MRQRPDTFIFLNADNEHLVKIAGGLKAVTYGEPGKGYDVEGEVVSCTPFVNLRWRQKGGEWQEIHTHLIGAYNVTNALAAAAVGLHFGVSAEAITRAISNYQPTNNRSELLETGHNTLVVDAYNANPTSMKAAFDSFRLISHPKKMAIVGEMRELGAASEEEHRRVVSEAETLGCDELWFVGDNFKDCAGAHRFFPDVEAVKKQLEAAPLKGCMVLIKGSNSTRLYQLPEYL